MILTVPVAKYLVTNAYFYIDDVSRCGFLIDPGAEAEKILDIIKREGFSIEKILLTHGHFDHLGAAQAVQDSLNIPIIMQEKGNVYAAHPEHNMSAFAGDVGITLRDVTCLPDESFIALKGNNSFGLKLISTPGHTLDGCIYYSKTDKAAFVGDSIFKASYGRTDLYGGDEVTLLRSIKEKILTLPEDTKLLPGHDEPTDVASERGRSWYRGL